MRNQRRGKPITTKRRRNLALVFCLIPGLVAAQANLSFKTGGGLWASRSKLPDISAAMQYGWQVGVTSELASYLTKKPSAVGSVRLGAFSLGQSSPSADGSLYRAWQGFNLDILGGVRSAGFPLAWPEVTWFASLQAGVGLRATKYTGTGLVSAHPAFIGTISLNAKTTSPLSVGIDIPFEYAKKSGADVICFGFGISARYR